MKKTYDSPAEHFLTSYLRLTKRHATESIQGKILNEEKDMIKEKTKG